MSYSVWDTMTKHDIDQATEKFIKLVEKKKYTYDKGASSNNTERQKNDDFLSTYIAPPIWRDSIVGSLQPTSCGDVRVKQNNGSFHNDNLMYVYFVECNLNRRGDRIGSRKRKVTIYIKVEIMKDASGKDCGLVISFHEAEFKQCHFYEQLPD